MKNEEVMRLIPWLLQARYPGRFRLATEGSPEMGWVVDTGDAVALVRAGLARVPFIWIRGGIAHAIPRSEKLAMHIAAKNQDLMVGRVYLVCGDHVAVSVFDEAILAGDIDVDRESCLQELVSRFENSLQYTAQWSSTIRAEFGGQPFTGDDWFLMTM
jgi:hypothetical protein